jgi:uncharacterized membrane protein
MRIRLESAKRIGRKIGINDDKAYAIAIILALIVVSSVVAGYYLVLRPSAEPYNTMYLLDAQKKAIDYPTVLVANQNSTFNVYVDVVNHLGQTANYQVQMKITKNLATLPVTDVTPSQVFDTGNVESGKSWETTATVTQNQPGMYSVVFELWQQNASGNYSYAANYCVLNIEVIS